jgi:hypothetical protein
MLVLDQVGPHEIGVSSTNYAWIELWHSTWLFLIYGEFSQCGDKIFLWKFSFF